MSGSIAHAYEFEVFKVDTTSFAGNDVAPFDVTPNEVLRK